MQEPDIFFEFDGDVLVRNNVREIGSGDQVLMLAHGFGCDQNMWRFLLPQLPDDYRIVLFDYVGSGNSKLSAFTQLRYSSLEGYAQDVVEICEALDLHDVIFVGHSVSGMIGLLAARVAPERFARQVLVCPSPCFLNLPPDYFGGFERQDLEDLLDLMDKNYIGWATYMAPMVIGANNPEALQGELSGSFCTTDPLVAKTFARATFFSDCRHILADAMHPALIVQSRMDALAPVEVGQYMRARMPDSHLHIIDAEGHCLHMTHPEQTAEALLAFVRAQ